VQTGLVFKSPYRVELKTSKIVSETFSITRLQLKLNEKKTQNKEKFTLNIFENMNIKKSIKKTHFWL
jgi:hypothetical protein